MTAHLSVTFPRATFIPRAAVPVGRSSAAPLRRRALLFPPGFPLPVWTRRRCAHPPTVAPPGGAAALRPYVAARCYSRQGSRCRFGRGGAAPIPQPSHRLGAQQRCAPTSPRAAIPARVPPAGSDTAALRPSPNRRTAWGRSSAAPLRRRALPFPPGFPLPVRTRRRCAHPPTVAPPGGAAALRPYVAARCYSRQGSRCRFGRGGAAPIPQPSRRLGAQQRCAPTRCRPTCNL
jgi:hypothetical protein